MQPLRIERGASKVRRTALKVMIDGTVADDLELMARWSENDTSYLVNLLLRFAIGQSEEFQQHKGEGPPSRPADRFPFEAAGTDSLPDAASDKETAP